MGVGYWVSFALFKSMMLSVYVLPLSSLLLWNVVLHLTVLYKAVLNIRTICHARDLWKLARSCKQVHLLWPPDPWNLPCTALLSGTGASAGMALAPKAEYSVSIIIGVNMILLHFVNAQEKCLSSTHMINFYTESLSWDLPPCWPYQIRRYFLLTFHWLTA